MFETLSPVDIGLPPHFSSWRPIQDEAAEFAIYNDRRFSVMSLPTGSGKSLTVMTIAKILGVRAVILTSTKGLQQQYLSDFVNPAAHVLRKLNVAPAKPSPSELIDIRGKANYPCWDLAHVQCDDGLRMGCKVAGTPNCTYSSSLKTARASQIVVTNYKYWMHINRGQSNGLARLPTEIGPPNPPQLLILDEAHLAPEELSSFLAIRLYEREILELLHTSSIQSELVRDWRQFAKEWKTTVKLEVAERTALLQKKRHSAPKAEVDTVRRLEGLLDKLDKLASMSNSGWVCEQRDGTRAGRVWEFDPVWPGLFAEGGLFCGVPKVILVSATVRPKTMGLLGVKTDQFKFKEWKRVFPANRCPVYHLPTARMNHAKKNDEENNRKWIERIDEIVASRLGRKGIIHTVSYDRQDYILRHSKFSQYMIGNVNDPDSPSAAEIVRRFKASSTPSILISPSFSTGWDFPYKDCEWQIISKIPFPSAQSKVMRERKERDPHYINHIAMQELVQACGRGMRAEDDRCETFIVDDCVGFFMAQSSHLKPDWFTVRKMAQLPPLPTTLP